MNLPQPTNQAADNEQWKDVVGYEGLYKISSLGTIISLERNVRRVNFSGRVTTKFVPSKIMKPSKATIGYLVVNLSKNGKTVTTLVHRLIAEAFIDNPNGKPEVNHKNGCRNDNSLTNLEWVTCSENAQHAFDVLGRKAGMLGRKGINARRCVATGSDGSQTYFESITEACRALGLSGGNVGMVIKGVRRHTKGYSFKYA